MSSLLERKRELEKQIELTKELNTQLELALDIVTNNPNINDGIQLASELGRLDIVSLILGLFAVFLGLFAFCGFWMVRGAAMKSAEAEAKKVINLIAPRMFEEAEKLNGDTDTKTAINLPETQQEAIFEQATEVKEDEL